MVVGDRLFVHPGFGNDVGQRRRGAVLIPLIERVAQTGSTSADLLARLASGEQVMDGAWLVADRQTAGRGRLGRVWNDELGNFMGSTVVQLRANDPSPASLALVAGVALTKAIATFAPELRAQLKWPNDVLIDGAKCTGILMERSGDAVVIGIGVNLAHAPALPDRKTASLAEHGVVIERDIFAGTLAVAMTDSLWNWRNQGVSGTAVEWLARAHPVGTPLHLSEQNVDGRFDGLSDEGALRLRCDDGSVMLVHAGDVELQRPPQEGG